MELLNNLQNRASGLGFRKNIDVCLPRLVNYKSDIYIRLPPEPEDDPDSECLVGRFCPFEDKLGIYAVADELGYVYFDTAFKTSENSRETYTRLHDNAIFDLAWFMSRSGEHCLVTASGDKTVKVICLKSKSELILTEHQQSLRALCTHPDHPGFLASAGRDGNIVIYDERQPTFIASNIIVGAHVFPSKSKSTVLKANNKSVTALVLKDSNTLISGGFTDGTVKVWDMRRTYLKNAAKQPLPLHTFNVGATVTSLNVHNSLLYASCTNHSIFCFNASTFEDKPVNKFVGHDTNTAYSSYMHASISECGHYLASGSYDGSIYIWSTKQGRSKVENIDETAHVYPIARLVGHEKEVTCVQWGFKSNQLMLLSLSDDDTHRLWRSLPPQDRPRDDDPLEGRTEILQPQFFNAKSMPRVVSSDIDKCPLQSPLKRFPSFVHQPESVIHKCSPRLPKNTTNWLTALSPQYSPNSPASASKPKVKRSVRTEKKSAKKLKLSSPIKTYIKIQPK